MLPPEQEKRYGRQILLPFIGPEGQARLSRSRVVVAGCGGLGSVSSQLMVRMGVGRVTVIDSDPPDITNLHRQISYDEIDVAAGHPKARTACEKLRRINSQVEVVGVAERLEAANADRLLSEHDVILDGTDNLSTRQLLNEWSIANGVPWVYGAVMFGTGHGARHPAGKRPLPWPASILKRPPRPLSPLLCRFSLPLRSLSPACRRPKPSSCCCRNPM